MAPSKKKAQSSDKERGKALASKNSDPLIRGPGPSGPPADLNVVRIGGVPGSDNESDGEEVDTGYDWREEIRSEL